MKIEIHNVYNPEMRSPVNPSKIIIRNLTAVNNVLKHLVSIETGIMDLYVDALRRNLENEYIGSGLVYIFELNLDDDELIYVRKFNDLQKSIVHFTCWQLRLQEDCQLDSDVEVLQLDEIRAMNILAYHRTNAFVEILGRENGIKLWKELVASMTDERSRTPTEWDEKSLKEVRDSALEEWCKNEIADFTIAIYDDFKHLCRFDRCVHHEAMKDLEDPEISYLSTCYIGDVVNAHPNYPGKIWKMRRTQTLHLADFCDELYWDINVYGNLEQPHLEFTANLGKD